MKKTREELEAELAANVRHAAEANTMRKSGRAMVEQATEDLTMLGNQRDEIHAELDAMQSGDA